MATFIKHKPCPNCGSKDNRAEYDDGSEWCFGCRDRTPPNCQGAIKKYLDKSEKTKSNNIVTLPQDAQPFLPEHAKRWLEKYNLTKKELDVLQPLYSFDKHLLIFPVYGPDGILMYQGRYFGDNEKHPKYLTYGAKDVLHIVGQDNSKLVLTEDVVSAVKVGTVINAMPLWGSGIPLGLAIRLSKRFKRLAIWLDMDKAKESLKTRDLLSPLFDEVTSIVTPLDPKEYEHDDIKRFVLE